MMRDGVLYGDGGVLYAEGWMCYMVRDGCAV